MGLKIKELNVWVPDFHILTDVTMTALHGQFMAIMGPSGAGKSTLLDFMAGRKQQAQAKGIRELNGKMVTKHEIMSKVAYLEQRDCLIGASTVRETFTFAAKLQLNLTKEELEAHVQGIIDTLGLTERADTLIGDENIRGLSGGEQRRVSIGQQLITDPEILLLDEPISGLDSTNANHVMKLCKELTAKGKIIIATVHQPSSKLIRLFDQVLLMANGKVVHQGSVPVTNDFFARQGQPVPAMFNPSDHYLDVISDKEVAATMSQKFYAEIEIREKEREERQHIEGKISSRRHTTKAGDLRRVNWGTQFMTLTERKMKQWFRDPVMLGAEMSQYMIIGIFMGSLYRPLSDSTVDGPFDRYSALFFYVGFLCFIPCFTIITKFDVERGLIKSETASSMYSMSAYFASLTFCTFLLEAVMIMTFALPTYYIAGFRSGAEYFFRYYAVYLIFVLICESIGLMSAVLAPNATIGIFILTGPLIIFVSLSGFLSAETPVYYDWVKYINYFHYTMVALIKNEMEGLEFNNPGGGQTNGSNLIRGNLSNNLSFAENVWVLVGMLAFFRLCGYLLLLRIDETPPKTDNVVQDLPPPTEKVETGSVEMGLIDGGEQKNDGGEQKLNRESIVDNVPAEADAV
mmetsp:Transcript_29015/g.50995  ORF Transcript_29015/g.50995 Transcript_29015/m.50995 type:complete len:631 (+) Transcript_29015:81-1973(+)